MALYMYVDAFMKEDADRLLTEATSGIRNEKGKEAERSSMFCSVFLCVI